MALVQQRFLGASVSSFQVNIGWGTSPSTLDVVLVEDDKAGDEFTYPSSGTPTVFTFMDFRFEGIIQRWRRSCSESGNPIFNVQLSDPREILEGVQIITGGYNGKVSTTPNILNIYGYYESQKFGSAESDDVGMPWKKIAQAIPILTNALFPSDYGGPVLYRNTRYALDISALPILPEYYKIGSDTNISVMEFINEVCEAAACDYFFEQKTNSDGIRFIVLNTISRKNAFIPGQIAAFASNTTEKVSVENGVENVNAVCGKMLVGGQKHEMYLQYYDAGSTSIYEDDTIWPYWGLNDANNLIIGQGIDDSHKFTVNCQFLPVVGLGTSYTMDVAELRAALDGRASWELFLSAKDNDEESIHYQKATRLNLNSDASIDLLVSNTKAGKVTLPNELFVYDPEFDPYTIHDYELGLLYEFVKQYAEEFYGKKFIVRIPFVYTAQDSETGEILTSRKPVDSAFIEETLWPNAIANNILPLDVDKLYTEEGKITAYVKFDLNKFDENGKPIYFDLTEISPEDIVMNANNTSAFVKCQVEPDIVFLDSATSYSPRVIITLPGCVRIKADSNPNVDGLVEIVKSKILPEDRPANFDTVLQQSLSSVASDNYLYGRRGICVMPTMAAIPLENQQETYGPWIKFGANGKMEFEKDDNMSPWNFGGDYATMNLVGDARVSESMSNLIEMENGTIEMPGVPGSNLGSALIANGPYITHIDVSFGFDGVRTRYVMEIWSPRFGKLQKAFIDRMSNFAKIQNRIRRNNRLLLQKTIALRNVNRYKSLNLTQAGGRKSKRMMNQSTHQILCGQTVNKDGEYKSTVASLPNYSFSQTNDPKNNKGGMSLDGLFVPFAAYEDNSNLPSFSNATVNHTLNPYAPGKHDISYVVRTSRLTSGKRTANINFDKEEDIQYRPLALRNPVVLAGWGKDTGGNVFPSGTDGNFTTDYRYNRKNWKVGPLDVRWDEDEGVWQATGSNLYCATLNEKDEITIKGKTYPTINCLGFKTCAGSKVIVAKYNPTVELAQNTQKYLIVSTIPCDYEEQEVTFVKDIRCNDDGNLIIEKQTIYFYGRLGEGITIVS